MAPYAAFLVTKQYCLALGLGMTEYWLEKALCPPNVGGQMAIVVRAIGLTMLVSGEAIRKLAMVRRFN